MIYSTATPCKGDASYFSSLCASACITEANDYLKGKCGVSLGAQCKSTIHQLYLPTGNHYHMHTICCCLDTVCAKDPEDQQYCFSSIKKIVTFGQLWNAFYKSCYGKKDCNDPTCNAAIEKV